MAQYDPVLTKEIRNVISSMDSDFEKYSKKFLLAKTLSVHMPGETITRFRDAKSKLTHKKFNPNDPEQGYMIFVMHLSRRFYPNSEFIKDDELAVILTLVAIIRKKCANCEKDENRLKKCGTCKIAYYCDEKCQKEHWNKIHKRLCK